jgi:hypothetical protein
MKPLVYYCRWQRVALRLRGRDSGAVWGQLVGKSADGQEEAYDFRYLLNSAELFVIEEQGEEHHYRLDEKGIPLPDEV